MQVIWIVLGYLVLIISQVYQLHVLLIGLVSIAFAWIQNYFIRNFLGCCVFWFLLSLAWLGIFGYHLPLLAFILLFLIHFTHFLSKKARELMTIDSKEMLLAEIISIPIVAVYVLAFNEFNWV